MCICVCMCVAGARVRRRAFWPPIPSPPMRSHVGTTRCKGPLFFFFLHRTPRARVLHNDRSRTKTVVDDAEGDDDDHTSDCSFGNKFDMLTHDTWNARVGDAMLGGWCTCRKGKLPCQNTKQKNKQKRRTGSPPRFPIFPFGGLAQL